MKNVPKEKMESFLRLFLSNMLKATEDKKEVERAVDALNEALYEYECDISLLYDSRDGYAEIVG
jgi:hypothetical protein